MWVCCNMRIRNLKDIAKSGYKKYWFNRCYQLLKTNPFQMHCIFRLAVPPMEKKLDSDSNEKESGEYKGVVYTLHPNP